ARIDPPLRPGSHPCRSASAPCRLLAIPSTVSGERLFVNSLRRSPLQRPFRVPRPAAQRRPEGGRPALHRAVSAIARTIPEPLSRSLRRALHLSSIPPRTTLHGERLFADVASRTLTPAEHQGDADGTGQRRPALTASTRRPGHGPS